MAFKSLKQDLKRYLEHHPKTRFLEPLMPDINGILRGLIRPNSDVLKGLKIGDIDPRGEKDYCYTISDKARAISGSVLEAILRVFPSNQDV